MSVVSLLGVQILNNPAKFTDGYQFEITFECLEQLEKGKRPDAPRREGLIFILRRRLTACAQQTSSGS